MMSNWELLRITRESYYVIVVESTDEGEIKFFSGLITKTNLYLDINQFRIRVTTGGRTEPHVFDYIENLYWVLIIEARKRGWTPMHEFGTFIRTKGD